MTTLYTYKDRLYPDYLRRGNAMQFIAPVAAQLCKGRGLDVGAGAWPLPGAVPVDRMYSEYADRDALNLPVGAWDYIFSSHCLEHLPNPVQALEHFWNRLRLGGTLFLYLPHPDMEYWRPQNCRKHLHLFHPADMVRMVQDIGFGNVLHSERDMAWSFAVVAEKL